MKRALLMLLLSCSACGAENAATTQSAERGPDVAMLDELVALYEPVPFDHKSHSKMSEMWNGCETCHHRKPIPATNPATLPTTHTQADSALTPKCKTCHFAATDRADVHLPSLKGAYHRQCLNCHREWTGENACVICHAPRNGQVATTAPAKDDIVGRMHPPIKEPKDRIFQARFTPVAGANVIFRHQEHSTRFGIRCATCHWRDNCSDCHSPGAETAAESARPRPMKPGPTWAETHAACIGCHQQDRCNHCHYPDDRDAPKAFEHASVGQLMDKVHANLACRECHGQLKAKPTCGDASCHPKRAVVFPVDRPGPVVKISRATTEPTTVPTNAPATQPATRPTIVRIRRGGS